MTKFEEIIIQEAKEDIIEEKCGSCKMFKSARTFEKNLKDTKDGINQIQIRLNDTQGYNGCEKSKQIFIDTNKGFHNKKILEEKEENKK